MRWSFGQVWEEPDLKSLLQEIIGDWRPPKFPAIAEAMHPLFSRVVEDAFYLEVLRRRWWAADHYVRRFGKRDFPEHLENRLLEVARALAYPPHSTDVTSVEEIARILCAPDELLASVLGYRSEGLLDEAIITTLSRMNAWLDCLARAYEVELERLFIAPVEIEDPKERVKSRRKRWCACADLFIRGDDDSRKIVDLKFRKTGSLSARDIRQMVFLQCLAGSTKDPEIWLTSHAEVVIVPVSKMMCARPEPWRKLCVMLGFNERISRADRVRAAKASSR